MATLVAPDRPHVAANRVKKTPRASQRRAAKRKPVTQGGSPGTVKQAQAGSRKYRPKDVWQAPGPVIHALREDFHVYVRQFGKSNLLLIDSLVETLDWDDSKPVQTGTVKLRDPQFSANTVQVQAGDQIILKVKSDGKFKEWWRMRVITPTASYVDGTRSFDVANELQRLVDSQGEFKYVSSKARPRGWLAHKVIADVLKRYGVPHAPIPKMKARIKALGPGVASPYDIIVFCLKREHGTSGRTYSIFYEGGRCVIRRKVRSNRLLMLGPLLLQASLQLQRKENFATQMLMRAVTTTEADSDTRGHRKRKHRPLQATVRSVSGVRRYGLVTRMGYVDADTLAQLKAKGKRHLALILQPDSTISVSHPGIPGLRRWDAVRVDVRADRDVFKNVMFVKEVRWNLSQGQFDMDLVLQREDPFEADPKDDVEDTLDAVAVNRGRVSPKKQPKKKKKSTKKSSQRKSKGNGPPKTSQRPPPKLGGVSTPVKR